MGTREKRLQRVEVGVLVIVGFLLLFFWLFGFFCLFFLLGFLLIFWRFLEPKQDPYQDTQFRMFFGGFLLHKTNQKAWHLWVSWYRVFFLGGGIFLFAFLFRLFCCYLVGYNCLFFGGWFFTWFVGMF